MRWADADDPRDRLSVLVVEAAAPEQQAGAQDDRPERVAQVVSEDADEHLSKLCHGTELSLASLCAALGRVGFCHQFLRMDRRADHLLVGLALVGDQRIDVASFVDQIPVGGSAFVRKRVGLVAPPLCALGLERGIGIGPLVLDDALRSSARPLGAGFGAVDCRGRT